MKLSNLFLCFLLFASLATATAQKEDREWSEGEYKETLATYPKLYVYPDGQYHISNKLPQERKEVAFAVVFYQKEMGKVKPTGKLSEKFVRKYLLDVEPFDPGKAMMRPPCCHVYDKNGRIVSSYYPPNSCPSDCKIPLRKGGRTFYLNCCPPSDMHRHLRADLGLPVWR